MNISHLIEELQRIQTLQGDVYCSIKLQFGQSHATGQIVDVKYRSTGIGRPFVQITAQEK